jgi:hypothetical protein
MSDECLAKTGLYFTEPEAGCACSASGVKLPGFWRRTPSGNLDAWICNVHSAIILGRSNYKSYLYKAILERSR